MSLQGWTLPLSPKGKAAALSPPPWYYSGEVLAIEFTLDPQRVAAYLPSPLGVDPEGRALMLFCDWCSAADNDPRLLADPGAGQYKEALIVLGATLDGKPVGRVPAIWVDNDTALVRGLVQGFPKKLGTVEQTRAVNIGRGGVRKAVDSRFAGHVSAQGHRLVTASVNLECAIQPQELPALAMQPLVHTRLFPRLDSAEPAVNELFINHLTDIQIADVFAGNATLTFHESEYEELEGLGLKQVGRGYLFSLAYSLTGGEVVQA